MNQKNDSQTDAFVPFFVTAKLHNSISLNKYHGIALDGLLAYAVRQENSFSDNGRHIRPSLIDSGLHTSSPKVIELPLAKCFYSDADLWHWATTSGLPLDPLGSPIDYTFEHDMILGNLSENKMFAVSTFIPQHVGGVKGRYRNKRTPIIKILASSLKWAGIGDPNEVLKLLENNIYSLGKKRNIGEGWISSWEIETLSDLSTEKTFIHSHFHPHLSKLGRPLPLNCVEECVRISDEPLGEVFKIRAGVRPPVFHESTQRTLYVSDS